MTEYAENETLLFDLRNRPASFDFITCIATSIALGIKHVRFVYGRGWKKKNYSIAQAEERWQSIVRPAPALFGIEYSIGERRGVEINHMIYAAIKTYNKTGRMGKIIAPVAPQNYVTLTLRKSRNPERDSNEVESLEFAKRCDRKVVILRDWEETPLDLGDRMKLYAGAYMNLGVINGPMTLLFHSDAPYICMRTIGCERSGSTSPEFSRGNGITPGFQFPWAGPRQKLSYLSDTADNLMLEYRAMQHVEAELRAA